MEHIMYLTIVCVYIYEKKNNLKKIKITKL